MSQPAPFPSVVLVDANFLVLAISNKRPSENGHKALHLLERAEKARAQVIIPTPALAEYLVMCDTACLRILESMERKAHIRVAPFDRAAAWECSQMDAAARGRGDKKDGSKDNWQKVKVDRQIVAIGKALNTQLIVSDDHSLCMNAARVGIRALSIKELPLPDELRQGKLKLVKGKTR